MRIQRLTTIEEPTNFLIGDKINIDHYTATCQEITSKGALFLMDQYLDKPMAMNRNNSNKGGYEESDLRKTLRSREVLDIFDDWRDRMVPFENGDLLRIPFFSEIFGQEDAEYFETDGCEQWELMKDRKNRNAFRQNCLEWGWLQNKRKGSAADFALVANRGYAVCATALGSAGVRPAFLITTRRKAREEADID